MLEHPDITCGDDNSKHSSAFSNGQYVNFYRHGFCYNKLKLLLTEKVFQSCLHCHTNACCSHNTCEYALAFSGWHLFIGELLKFSLQTACSSVGTKETTHKSSVYKGQTRQACWRNFRAHTLNPNLQKRSGACKFHHRPLYFCWWLPSPLVRRQLVTRLSHCHCLRLYWWGGRTTRWRVGDLRVETHCWLMCTE